MSTSYQRVVLRSAPQTEALGKCVLGKAGYKPLLWPCSNSGTGPQGARVLDLNGTTARACPHAHSAPRPAGPAEAQEPAGGERGGGHSGPRFPIRAAQDCAVAVDTVSDVTVCPLLAWSPEAGIRSVPSPSAQRTGEESELERCVRA